jgi:hypothetical protein
LNPPVAVLEPGAGDEHHFNDDDFTELLDRHKRPEIAKAIGLSALVVALSLGLSEWLARVFAVENSALIPGVRQMYLSYKLGMYLIYVFCFVVASMASLENLVRVDVAVAVFLFGTILGSLLLHALLCRLAGIDSDTFMVTSVAAVCSPPFVPMMARALGQPAFRTDDGQGPGQPRGHAVGYDHGDYRLRPGQLPRYQSGPFSAGLSATPWAITSVSAWPCFCRNSEWSEQQHEQAHTDAGTGLRQRGNSRQPGGFQSTGS